MTKHPSTSHFADSAVSSNAQRIASETRWWHHVIAASLFIPAFLFVWFLHTRLGEQMLLAIFFGRKK